MKSVFMRLISILSLSIILTSCFNNMTNIQNNSKDSLSYSNLVDKESQDEVRTAMEIAGVSNDSINRFFMEVDNYNETVSEITLVKSGFLTINSLEPEYDLISMIELWDGKNPKFIGYNCRITTFDLMKDLLSINRPNTDNSDWLVFEEDSLKNNPLQLFSEKEYKDFKTLYAFVPTSDTKDINIHLKNIQTDWKDKEINFLNNDSSSIISVIFHDEEGYLFVGHTGILFVNDSNDLIFIEKLSFQVPYQAIKFANKTELNDYLMNKYDISWDQTMAKPFIMENDELLKEYRVLPNNKK